MALWLSPRETGVGAEEVGANSRHPPCGPGRSVQGPRQACRGELDCDFGESEFRSDVARRTSVVEAKMIPIEVAGRSIRPVAAQKLTPNLPCRTVGYQRKKQSVGMKLFGRPLHQWSWVCHVLDDICQEHPVVRRGKMRFDPRPGITHRHRAEAVRCEAGSFDIGFDAVDVARKVADPAREITRSATDV